MAKHPLVRHGKVGVLLMNLGTPEAPTAAAVRNYLREFLSDRRVIEISPLLWQVILRGVILPFRSRKSAKAYAKIWRAGGSPLRLITEAQSTSLAASLAAVFGEDEIIVDWAMRYGVPSVADKIKSLQERGCDRILFCPLYPQYAAATTASAQDAVFAQLAELRRQPAVRFLPPYYDASGYIAALRRSILRRVHFDAKRRREEKYHQALLMSFHGLPQRNLHLGDPYYCHCHKTARLLRESLGLGDKRGLLSFQSRFGAARWLQPYSDEVVKALPGRGVKRLAVVCPGFSADCLETLEEVNMGLREDFLSAGGKVFTYIDCLNDSALGIGLLGDLVRRELMGWCS